MSNPDTTRIFNYPEVTTPASDAKILLDSQTVGSKCIDANLFRCDLIDKTITQRGTFEASEDDADGFKKVVVDIPYTDVHVASGPIATFEGEDLPLKSLTASIVPVQSGSGDPSPTNVRPISGWTGCVVNVTGVNVWDEEWENGSYSNITGAKTVSANKVRNKNLIPVLPNTEYYCKLPLSVTALNVYWFDKNKQFLFADDEYGIRQNSKFTVPNGCCYLGWSTFGSNYTSYNNDISINYPSTDTEYHAYSGTTTTIPFTDGQGQSVEVYGGSVDAVNGVVTPCPYYASYNGEQLTGEWISDRDVYSPNTTPTIGAQVVNIGATGTPFNVQPTSIKSLEGKNNICANTGDVDVEYQTVWVRPTE